MTINICSVTYAVHLCVNDVGVKYHCWCNIGVKICSYRESQCESMMKMTSFVLPFFSIAVCVTVGVCFSISCGSRFTTDGTSFCVGTPIECSVSLDPDLCVAGEDNFTGTNLGVSVFESGVVEPQFEFSQDGSFLRVVLDYIPESNMSMITVHLLATVSANCSFGVSHRSTARSSSSQCNYPLSFKVNRSEPAHPAIVKGGDLIELALELTADSATVQRLSFSLNASHPALALVSYGFASVEDGAIASMAHLDIDPLVEVVRLVRSDTLLANLTFRVQPYVQPGARLYFSFRVSYHVPSYGTITFTQGFKFFDEYMADGITHGNLSFSLTSYADIDRMDFVFPPNVDDIFSVDIPIIVPCVSTDLNVSVAFPVFLSDNFTMFLTNVTDVKVALPDNLVRIAGLCQYQDPQFTRSLCEVRNLELASTPWNITKAAERGPGVDSIYINLGPVLYNFTNLEDCTTNSSATNCTCDEDNVIITVTGHVANDSILCENENHIYTMLRQSPCGIFCENQTLADNITLKYAYISEVTAETAPMQLDTNPSIRRTVVSEDGDFPVNASMPAINVPINSFTGDAGDSYNLTFDVLHDSEYSSFTAYDLNYTFSVDPHLEPDENITICFFNESSDPLPCEEVPFINYTISRLDFHPE